MCACVCVCVTVFSQPGVHKTAHALILSNHTWTHCSEVRPVYFVKMEIKIDNMRSAVGVRVWVARTAARQHD